ncbi:MAG: hypothetical protein ABI647_16910, partial [Gemmatimonadota bacterium]
MLHQAADTSRLAAQAVDSGLPINITNPPLPGGVAAVFRFFFQVPQWIQIGGFALALIVGLGALVYLWRHRRAIALWLATRSRGTALSLLGLVLLLIVLAGGTGLKTWNYMQHDNGFCTGCHVMNVPFGKFQARAGKHDSLQCHACHQQSIFASSRQLVLWVANRPTEIGKHAKVPTSVCAGCHVTG